MDAAQRRQILDQLNTLDTGPTEDDRRAERQATIERAIETEQALKWGRISASGMLGLLGRSTPSH